jgi:hypothetical protein
MNLSTSDPKAEDARSDRGVLCSKCEHLNIWGRNECKRCGARLYIACNDCGHKNERVRSRCTSCNRRLHYSAFEKMRRRMQSGVSEMKGTQVVIFCVGIAVALVIIMLFAKFDIRHLF